MTDNTSVVNRLLEQSAALDGGCRVFTRGKTGAGYGAFYVGNGRCRGAHVVSYELHKGPIPEGQFVLHTCDNPACINPEHLFLGTLQDNKTDEVLKGRHVFGEKVGNSKLTTDEIREIKLPLEKGFSLSSIGRRYNVTRQNIYRIKHNKTWKHV